MNIEKHWITDKNIVPAKKDEYKGSAALNHSQQYNQKLNNPSTLVQSKSFTEIKHCQ